MHRALRYTYLVAIAASMPAAIWYLNKHPASIPLPRALFMVLIFMAGTVFHTIFLLMSQVQFPEKMPGACVALCTLALNGITGVAVADFDIFYGAYAVVTTHLIALCIYLVYYLALYAVAKEREKLYFVMSEKATFILFAGIFLFFGVTAWAFSGPFIAELTDGSPRLFKLIFVAAFTVDLFLNARAYIRHNMMLAVHNEGKQASVVAEHAWPFSLALISSMLVAVILAGIYA